MMIDSAPATINAITTAEQFGDDYNPEPCNAPAKSVTCPVHAKAPRVEQRRPAAGMHGQSLTSFDAAKG